MEVLELKRVKNKKIVVYMSSKENAKYFQNVDHSKLVEFLKKNNIDFVTVDFQVDMKEFGITPFAYTLDELKIPYFQVDIPDYAMGYLYQEIIEKQEFQNELFEEYESMEDKDSYKGLSLKNWIDMLGEEIQEREIFLSLKLRPQWIVKKMLDLALSFKKDIVVFVHFVQEDICEDICPQVVENLRELGVKVISYNKKHLIQKIIF
ncbi:MAG: hypothetical protein HWN81_13845 [Candidatus Lokiarchaeota archaeon]|nr:hypothetical protein [Candidatus Lokiarchaeota archaeon]